MTSYLVKKQTTVSKEDNESYTHYTGDVVSEWELTDHVKSQIDSGVPWYTQTYEKLTDRETEQYRKKATAADGKRQAPNGQVVDPPWDDFVGLHPKDVIDRMKKLSFDDVEKVRQYERAGMNRPAIIEFVAPSEREPWNEYDNWSVRDITDKMDVLDSSTVQDVIVYEMNHKNRPAIIEWAPDDYEAESVIEDDKSSSHESEESSDNPGPIPAGVGASTEAGGQP